MGIPEDDLLHKENQNAEKQVTERMSDLVPKLASDPPESIQNLDKIMKSSSSQETLCIESIENNSEISSRPPKNYESIQGPALGKINWNDGNLKNFLFELE